MIYIRGPPKKGPRSNNLSPMANDQTIDTMHLFHIGCTRFQVLFFDAYCLWHTAWRDMLSLEAEHMAGLWKDPQKALQNAELGLAKGLQKCRTGPRKRLAKSTVLGPKRARQQTLLVLTRLCTFRGPFYALSTWRTQTSPKDSTHRCIQASKYRLVFIIK